MSLLVEYLVLGAFVLGVVAMVQVLAARWCMAESTALCVLGIAIGTGHLAIVSLAPRASAFLLAPLIDPALPSDAYLWLFLPPLVYQAALAADVRTLLLDAAPVLLLSVVAVVAATVFVGVALTLLVPFGLVACLLLGAIVGETDASAVIAAFRNVGAPERLIRLVEGESLLNDAAALALASVLLAMLTGDNAHATVLSGLWVLGTSFIGGLLIGSVVGRLVAAVLPLMRGMASAEAALTMSVPYPLYLLASDGLHVSGVIAVVCAGLVINGLARTRLAPVNWSHLQLLWQQIAVLAGAAVFLLAALQAPHLLAGATWHDALLLAVALIAALLARLLVLFVMLPPITRLQSAEPISTGFKLVMAWGGLRGALTLILAMGVAQNQQIPAPTRTFISLTAAGFALFSLLVNGTTLRWFIRSLGLDRLTAQQQALQQQALELSVRDVDAALMLARNAYRIDASTLASVSEQYRRDLNIDAARATPDASLKSRDQFIVGLITLATHERDLIPEFGEGVIGVHNLDLMMRNAGQMIEASRCEGRHGYMRVARQILAIPAGHRVAQWLHDQLRIDWPLRAALTQRFELLVCRRAVLERLRDYNRSRLAPLFGARISNLLDSLIATRIALAQQAIHTMRVDFAAYTLALERRLLQLYALRRGRASIRAMVSEQAISGEVAIRLQQALANAWGRAIKRPQLDAQAGNGRR